MIYKKVTAMVEKICRDADQSFQDRANALRQELGSLEQEEVMQHLLEAGVISERFGHDSTEEKLYAKYCDIILARALSYLGITSYALDERSDAADVYGKVSGKYSLVADAKAFRLSRTAKNQKDFKVGALNTWRKGADYAILVSPLYQYPTSRSQIYDQSVRYNVIILSYTHLYFILTCSLEIKLLDLEPLWKVHEYLEPTLDARAYWNAIDNTMCNCCGVTLTDWEKAREEGLKMLPKQARDEVAFWENEKQKIKQLNQKEAVEQLIKALKIDAKISVIKRTAGI